MGAQSSPPVICNFWYWRCSPKPRHGYEIIKALGERSRATTQPGWFYPALTYLEEIGYATVEADGARKLYHITETGTALLGQNRACR